jgi:hypothetical protein
MSITHGIFQKFNIVIFIVGFLSNQTAERTSDIGLVQLICQSVEKHDLEKVRRTKHLKILQQKPECKILPNTELSFDKQVE